MRAVYLVGNGFDIKLGLKTTYSDFYEYYLKTSSNNLRISEFKKLLLDETKNTEKWSDLELALGEHLEVLSTAEDFDLLFDDIQDELAEYLIEVQDQFRESIQSKTETQLAQIESSLLKQLFAPENHLRGRDATLLREFYKRVGTRPDYFNIINFNYTNTIETLLRISTNSTEFENLTHSRNLRNTESKLNNLYHVHGTTDENMVLGVDRKEQMGNDSFARNPDITSQFIKSECNLAQRHGVELKCQNLIINSDLIIIFGSSLGKTDELWWELIANQLHEKRHCLLLVFIYNENIKKRNPSRSERYRRALIKRIFGKEVPEAIDERLIVAFNSDIFSLEI